MRVGVALFDGEKHHAAFPKKTSPAVKSCGPEPSARRRRRGAVGRPGPRRRLRPSRSLAARRTVSFSPWAGELVQASSDGLESPPSLPDAPTRRSKVSARISAAASIARPAARASAKTFGDRGRGTLGARSGSHGPGSSPMPTASHRSPVRDGCRTRPGCPTDLDPVLAATSLGHLRLISECGRDEDGPAGRRRRGRRRTRWLGPPPPADLSWSASAGWRRGCH
jgi:hypothetical protein